MRLFGERGYKETTVAQIEAAVGLSPGSGSLYKHFSSKEALLAAGVEALLSDRAELREALEPRDMPRRGNIAEMQTLLQIVASAGLNRMRRDRNINRLLFRGLQDFPGLLSRYRDGEITANHEAVAVLLSNLADEQSAEHDWPAIAAVLVGATAHYWILTDLFGTHPSGVDEERYTRAVALLASRLLVGTNPTS
jgi:AcrR family transcriptional regulator